MTLNGCPPESSAAREMRHALSCDEFDVPTLNIAHAALLADLEALTPRSTGDAAVQLTLANSLWARGALQPAFSDAVTATFGAAVQPLTSAAPINAWCAEHTRGKIASIIDHVAPLDRLILVNAVYFKGAWQWTFDKMHSQDGQPFTGLSGKESTVTMMHMHRKDFRYVQVVHIC